MKTDSTLQAIVSAGRAELPSATRLDHIRRAVESATAAAAVTGAAAGAQAATVASTSGGGAVGASTAASVGANATSAAAASAASSAAAASSVAAASATTTAVVTTGVGSSTATALGAAGGASKVFAAAWGAATVGKFVVATALVASGTTAVLHWSPAASDTAGSPAPSTHARRTQGDPSTSPGSNPLAIGQLDPATPEHEEGEPEVEAAVPRDSSDEAEEPPRHPQRQIGKARATPNPSENATAVQRQVNELLRLRTLVSENPAAALARLNAFPTDSTPLAEEAAWLRIEALRHAARREEARSRAEQFLRDHPHSPYRARLRSLLADPNPP